MSLNPMKWEGNINPRIQTMQHTKSCLVPMGKIQIQIDFVWFLRNHIRKRRRSFWRQSTNPRRLCRQIAQESSRSPGSR